MSGGKRRRTSGERRGRDSTHGCVASERAFPRRWQGNDVHGLTCFDFFELPSTVSSPFVLEIFVRPVRRVCQASWAGAPAETAACVSPHPDSKLMATLGNLAFCHRACSKRTAQEQKEASSARGGRGGVSTAHCSRRKSLNSLGRGVHALRVQSCRHNSCGRMSPRVKPHGTVMSDAVNTHIARIAIPPTN